MVAIVRGPADGPAWLPFYTRNVEREIDRAIAGAAASVSDVTGGFTVDVLDGETIFAIYVPGLTVRLPATAGNTAKLTFKMMVAGSFTLLAASGEMIDGAASLALTLQYEAVTLFSSGSQWMVIMAYQPMAGIAGSLESVAETAEFLRAATRAQVHLTAQMVALARGRNDPMPSDEGDALICEFSNKDDM